MIGLRDQHVWFQWASSFGDLLSIQGQHAILCILKDGGENMNQITRQKLFHTVVLCGIMLFIAGCSQQDKLKNEFHTTINNYYQAHPSCLWSDAKKFPVQAATSDDAKTQGYDALTDAGLLTRTTAEKKVMILASKQVNNYEISTEGRSAWTADPTQPAMETSAMAIQR